MDSTTPTTQRRQTPATPDQLRNAVTFMDCLSNNGFDEIIAIAKLALAWLETPNGYQHLDVVASALNAIWGKAENIQNSIGWEVEQVGCDYVDEHQKRRWDAQRAHREQEAAAAAPPAQKREEVEVAL